MRKLLNTLYITKEDAYLSLNNENICVKVEDDIIARYPLHNFESIVTFSHLGISPALAEICVKKGINICFLNPFGRYKASITGEIKGNVLLRRQQFRLADNEEVSLIISRNIIVAKVYNERWIIERYARQYPLRVDVETLKNASYLLKDMLSPIALTSSKDSLRGFEGNAQSVYFSVFNELVLNQKEEFRFIMRSRRPPLDRINAMLSFAYSLLTNDIKAALETVGLDPYVGFMHVERPGRASLALDLVEELRGPVADRFVLSLINKRIISSNDFNIEESGAVCFTDKGRKIFLSEWQNNKKQELTHPFLNEKIEWGLVPYVQAQLLARYIRGDIDEYPPFFWK